MLQVSGDAAARAQRLHRDQLGAFSLNNGHGSIGRLGLMAPIAHVSSRVGVRQSALQAALLHALTPGHEHAATFAQSVDAFALGQGLLPLFGQTSYMHGALANTSASPTSASMLQTGERPLAPRSSDPDDSRDDVDAVVWAAPRGSRHRDTPTSRKGFPDLWEPGVAKGVPAGAGEYVDAAAWNAPPGFDTDSSGLGLATNTPGERAASESQASARARANAARLVASAPDPGASATLPGTAMPQPSIPGASPGDKPKGQFDIGDRVDAATARGWIAGRVTGQLPWSDGQVKLYSVVLDSGKLLQSEPQTRLRWHLEQKCSPSHVGMIFPPGLHVAGQINPAAATAFGTANQMYSPDPVNMPFQASVGLYFIPKPWLQQASGDTCSCPCPVPGHSRLELQDCIDIAKQEQEERDLEDADRRAGAKEMDMMSLFYAAKGNFDAAMTVFEPIPPPILTE